MERDDDIQSNGEFNPYNSQNIEIRLSDVQSILERYGISPMVNNLNLYKRAFVHRSYVMRYDLDDIVLAARPPDCLPLSSKSNERLEFLGDGVLECVTKYLLYRRFPKEDEGFMTEKKIAIVKNEAIGRIALDMGLHKWLVISRGAEEKKTRNNLKKLGCLFEAFVGAIFLDYNKIIIDDEDHWFRDVFVCGPGFQVVQKFIETVFEKHIDWTELIKSNDNYKNQLQVKIQKEFKVTPHYLQINRNLEDGYVMGVYLCIGQPIHSMSVTDATMAPPSFEMMRQQLNENVGKVFFLLGEGKHKIKQKAEQLACYEAIKYIV